MFTFSKVEMYMKVIFSKTRGLVQVFSYTTMEIDMRANSRMTFSKVCSQSHIQVEQLRKLNMSMTNLPSGFETNRGTNDTTKG